MGESQLLRARYAGTCAGCGAAIARGERARWDAGGRRLWCLPCHDRAAAAAARPAGPPAPDAAHDVDAGEAGRSAQLEYERRHAARERRIERRWGRLASVVKILGRDPQSTTAWSRGAEGERLVARRLAEALGSRAVLLHDRRIPGSRANIDLLAVAPSGVWIVDAKHWAGRIEQRDVGGWSATDRRLYAGGRDRSAQVEAMGRQVLAVSRALPDTTVPLVPALCVVGGSWGWFAEPFRCRGVWVAWPDSLARLMLAPGPLTTGRRDAVAAALASVLRPNAAPQ